MKRLNSSTVLLFGTALLLFFSCRTTYITQNDFDVAPQFAKNKWNAKLLMAVKNSDLQTARECLEHKAKPQVYDCLKQSALMYACWNSDLPMVHLLCEWRNTFLSIPLPNTVNVNNTSLYGYTALFCAAYKGNDTILEYLIGKKAQFARVYYQQENQSRKIIEIIKDRNGENILHKLAKSQNANAVQKFIKEHPTFAEEDIWQRKSLEKNNNGYTPFHLAVIGGKVELVRLLLSLDKTKRVLNEGANEYTFPLYTAFEIRNLEIFRLLLEQPKTNIHCPTPLKKTKEEYQAMTVQTFSEKETNAKILTRQYSTNFFQSMYVNRLEWEKRGRRTALVIDDSEVMEQYEKFYEFVCDGTKGIEDLEKIKNFLGTDLSSASICEGKRFDLLQQAIRTPRSLEKKLEVLSFLLDSGVSSRNLNDSTQALSYALDIAADSGNKDYVKVAEFLIRNHAKYVQSYSLINPKSNRPWMKFLGNENIRNTLTWNDIKDILQILNRAVDFTNERNYVFKYIIVGNSGSPENNLAYKQELFDYFYYLLNIKFNTPLPENKPISIWLYENNFRYGLRRILNDKVMTTEIQNIKNDVYYQNGTRLLDLLKAANDTEFLQLYYAVYPEENPDMQKPDKSR